MAPFVKIPPAEFRQLSLRAPEDFDLYAHDNPVLRAVFWRRLVLVDQLLQRHARDRSSCLDLGTGSGILLPTLASRFAAVHAVDRDTSDAANMVAAHRLSNVVLHQRDVLAEPFESKRFAAIVAADVLEHFPDTAPIAQRVHDWLADDGVLVTSLPTESWVYVLLRRVFGIEKPPDHYFSAAEVEASLTRAGLRALRRRHVPLEVPGTGLFLVTAWRRATAGER